MVHIVQLLCPQRHCIMAVAFDPADGISDEDAIADLEAKFLELTASGPFNSWCGLCGSRELKAEVGVTKFATMEEATPALRDNEERQRATREYFQPKRN